MFLKSRKACWDSGVVTSVSAIGKKCAGALWGIAACSIVCEFISWMEALKEALCVICVGIIVGKKGV